MAIVEQQIVSIREFLRLAEIRPSFEFLGGRIIQKMSPRWKHGILQTKLGAHLDNYSGSKDLGQTASEVRCTFGGESHVFDLCFYAKARIPTEAEQDRPGGLTAPPDLAIEILSPGQTVGELTRKLRSAIRRGVRLGWSIDDRRRAVHILRPSGKRETLRAGEILTGEDIVPGYVLPIDEMLGWLQSG